MQSTAKAPRSLSGAHKKSLVLMNLCVILAPLGRIDVSNEQRTSEDLRGWRRQRRARRADESGQGTRGRRGDAGRLRFRSCVCCRRSTPSTSASGPISARSRKCCRQISARSASSWSRPATRSFTAIARYLCDRLGDERFEVLPHVSSMQLAFARVKESWEEAYLTDLSTRPLDDVLDRIRGAETVGLFTSET